MMSSLGKKIFYAVIILVSFAAGIYYVSTAAVVPKLSSGVGQVLKEDLIQRVTISGIVTPVRKMLIAAPYNGYVKKLYVKVGDQVKAGDPIVSVVQSLQAIESVFPLRAPFDGQVVQIRNSEGEFVKENDSKEYILRIDDLSQLFVLSSAPEIDRAKIKQGQEAIIKATAIQNKNYKGILRELSLAATEKEKWSWSQVVEFPIRIEIMDSDTSIIPGMSVLIDIITDKKEKVLTLRHEFIRRDGDVFYVVRKNGKRQNIKVGTQNEESYEILSGLNQGDQIQMVDFASLDQ